MFAINLLTEEERRVDADLGYPPGYAMLCRNSHDMITPFSHGPPHRFHPYDLHPDEIAKVQELNELFPVVECQERDPFSNARRFADSLWQQLDHLGNAGFDPDKYRVDPYGNVLYRNAGSASPLAWEVDHWFPHSRGGKTIESNLRLVQWQVNQRKQNKLEFLVPWWDLQLGVSVNQFLSIFASKNTDFRERALNFMFSGGKNEPLRDGHSWPRHFRERKAQIGISPAAIVRVRTQPNVDQSTSTHAALPPPGTPMRRRWTVEEEEALRRGIKKFGAGNWKEIKESEPLFRSRSAVQIKDKYRQMKGEWELEKENKGDEVHDKELILARAVQKESRLKKIREGELPAKEQEMCRLNRELKELQQQNESDCSAIEDLESVLIKQRNRMEKQRQWSETQFSYRMCLEKMIADAMHQSVAYKERGRLNQAACNALMARLETHKVACDASEMELIKISEKRENLETLIFPHPEFSKKEIKMKLDEPLTCSHLSPDCAVTKIIDVAGAKESEILEAKESSKEEGFKLSQNLRSLSEGKQAENTCCTFVVAEIEQGKGGMEVEATLSTRKTESGKEKPRVSEADESESECELDILIVGYEYGGGREADSVGDNMTLAGSPHSKFQVLSKEESALRIGEWNHTEEDGSCKLPGKTIEFPEKTKETIGDSSRVEGKEMEGNEMIRNVSESNWLLPLSSNPQEKEELESSDNIFPAIAIHESFQEHKSPLHNKASNCRRSEEHLKLNPIITSSAHDLMVKKLVPDCLHQFQSLQTKNVERGTGEGGGGGAGINFQKREKESTAAHSEEGGTSTEHKLPSLKNGLSASLKPYAHIWEKAVERLRGMVIPNPNPTV